MKRVDGSIREVPKRFFESFKMSRVPDIGISSHDLMYLHRILSKFSLTKVKDILETVMSQLILDKT